ncbi:MAG: Crp/Fnr family transcriptional regulator [Clostridia bacterium]|nr:Crp/Fnr family transcriptional regulator [Clostridia bacterium]
MKKYFGILRKCSLFEGVEDQHLITMLSCLGAKREVFDKKYTIFAEGNPAKFFGILLSGSAQIIRHDYYGNRSIVSGIVPGELFCESFACAGVPTLPVSIIANEPCEVLLIDSSHVLHTCSNGCDFHRKMIYNLMRDLAAKNIMFHQKLDITGKRSTREKLLAYLAYMEKQTGSVSFDIPFDRQELADYLEVDRSGLSAEISKLRGEGVIECRKNHFTLL